MKIKERLRHSLGCDVSEAELEKLSDATITMTTAMVGVLGEQIRSLDGRVSIDMIPSVALQAAIQALGGAIFIYMPDEMLLEAIEKMVLEEIPGLMAQLKALREGHALHTLEPEIAH